MKKRGKSGKRQGEKKIVEQGAIVKKGRDLIKTALVFPNTYRAGMSSLGFQTVYRLANQIETVACERVFWDKKQKIPNGPKSVETGSTLAQFDMILFSISFENDFIHLVQLLGEAGIPLRSPDRNHIHPLVVAGGVACFLNPEPIAPFIDCFLLGEAECQLENFFNAFSDCQGDHPVFLKEIEKKIPGAYVPQAHPDNTNFKIAVPFLENLDNITTSSVIMTSDTAFKDTFLIETLKGCPHGCRFCSAGFIYRPPRHYPLTNLTSAVDSAAKKAGRIGLVSSAVADHPQIRQLCDYALEKNFSLSFSSLRADKLSQNLIDILSRSGLKTATIAPEAGSERMRLIINKKISETDIVSAAQKLVNAGIINLRLYFMIGLPFEQEDDIKAIVDLTKKIKAVFLEASRKKQKIGTITLSINPFIPKPATPFQWAAMTREKVLKSYVALIRNGLKKVANVSVNVESIRQARLYALFSLGGRKTADVIKDAAQKGPTFALKQHAEYINQVVYHEKETGEPLPWDFLDTGVKKEFLIKEYNRARRAEPSASCQMISCTKCRTCMDPS